MKKFKLLLFLIICFCLSNKVNAYDFTSFIDDNGNKVPAFELEENSAIYTANVNSSMYISARIMSNLNFNKIPAYFVQKNNDQVYTYSIVIAPDFLFSGRIDDLIFYSDDYYKYPFNFHQLINGNLQFNTNNPNGNIALNYFYSCSDLEKFKNSKNNCQKVTADDLSKKWSYFNSSNFYYLAYRYNANNNSWEQTNIGYLGDYSNNILYSSVDLVTAEGDLIYESENDYIPYYDYKFKPDNRYSMLDITSVEKLYLRSKVNDLNDYDEDLTTTFFIENTYHNHLYDIDIFKDLSLKEKVDQISSVSHLFENWQRMDIQDYKSALKKQAVLYFVISQKQAQNSNISGSSGGGSSSGGGRHDNLELAHVFLYYYSDVWDYCIQYNDDTSCIFVSSGEQIGDEPFSFSTIKTFLNSQLSYFKAFGELISSFWIGINNYIKLTILTVLAIMMILAMINTMRK